MSPDEKFDEEAKRLERVRELIRAQMERIGPRYAGNDYTEQVLDSHRQERKRRLAAADREPYFGRLDFREEGKERPEPIYIGKFGVSDLADQTPLVIDWRAPIASLFYSFAGGDPRVAYESPEGVVHGTVSLKRNVLIRQGELQRVVDSYAEGQEQEAVTDEFLLHRLGESKDNRLRDIVSTIQQEQDAIIRTEKNKILFVQGVAGSGKTTVALHRLAYLLYRYQDRLRADRMMILAPNRMFLQYISGVLPELGVGDIRQTTFAEWALELLGEGVELQDSDTELARWFERKTTARELDEAPGRRKGSLEMLRRIDAALLALETNLIPDEPFRPAPDLWLPAEQIRAWFREEPADEPLMKRRERLTARLRRWMEIEIGRNRWSDKTVRANATAKWKAYVRKLPQPDACAFYTKQVLGEAVSAAGKAAKGSKRPAAVAAEDLPALAYIQLRLYGAGNTPFYDHIVIDEAQDYSPLQLAVLKERQRVPSMTVLGDLQQGIHGYIGIRNWDELTEVFDRADTAYYELDRSYRSTTEIIEFANRILAGMEGGVKPAKPVFRSGRPVETEAVGETDPADAVAGVIRQWLQDKELHTVAVLCRTAASCERLHAALGERGIAATLVKAKQQDYEGGLTVVPAYLSKGLEFDAVLIPDADEDQYGPQDAKLLYVACTRALHRLKLLYRNRLTPLLAQDENHRPPVL